MMKSFTLALLLSAAVVSGVRAQVTDTEDNTVTYNNCVDLADGSIMKLTECTVQETRRIYKLVQEKYKELAAISYFSRWNAGSGSVNSNMQKLLTDWVNYRDLYCSLYGYAYSQGEGTITPLNEAECSLELTKRHNKDMDAVITLYKENSDS